MTLELGSEQERNLHLTATRQLAREMHVPEERVVEAYALALQRLQGAARIKMFLPVLAAKQVKALFRRAER